MPHGKTVLVVDDEPHIRGFLAMVLEDEGYHVETASDGCEALTKACTQSPDAILLDLLMPVLDGAGFLRDRREHLECSAVPVLVMSAQGTRVHAETLGVQGVLMKPFDYDALLRMLASVL
jgi:DNA-binding response OmpR family regulator